jgi:hypothetical protein
VKDFMMRNLILVACLVVGTGCHESTAKQCVTTPMVTASPTTLYGLQQSHVVYSGTGFTPNSMVTFENISGFTAACRGLVIVPGSTLPTPADANGAFSTRVPMTAFGFSLMVGDFDMVFHDTCGETATVTLHFTDGGTADTYLTPGLPTTPLSAVAAAEHGSGTIVAATDGGLMPTSSGVSGTFFRTDIQFTLSGATANQTYTSFLKAAGQCDKFGTMTPDAMTRSFGTVTTDASGNATAFFHTYPSPMGDPRSFAPILSLTTDGNLPDASNVAYSGTVTFNQADFSHL